VVDEGDAESSDPDKEMIIKTRSRVKSHIALLGLGKSSRTRKVYKLGETSRQDPKSPREIMEKDDAEL